MDRYKILGFLIFILCDPKGNIFEQFFDELKIITTLRNIIQKNLDL